jgi:hypothetical protein
MTTEQERLKGARVTLDGEPATIVCSHTEHGTLPIVWRLDGVSRRERSWDAVARVVASGGAFES